MLVFLVIFLVVLGLIFTYYAYEFTAQLVHDLGELSGLIWIGVGTFLIVLWLFILSFGVTILLYGKKYTSYGG